MLQNHYSRTPAARRIALVCGVAVMLMVSRSATISVPKASLAHNGTVQCQSTLPKRQTLDRDAVFEFGLIARKTSICPPAASFVPQPCTDDPLLPFQPDSYLHNRPPPQS